MAKTDKKKDKKANGPIQKVSNAAKVVKPSTKPTVKVDKAIKIPPKKHARVKSPPPAKKDESSEEESSEEESSDDYASKNKLKAELSSDSSDDSTSEDEKSKEHSISLKYLHQEKKPLQPKKVKESIPVKRPQPAKKKEESSEQSSEDESGDEIPKVTRTKQASSSSSSESDSESESEKAKVKKPQPPLGKKMDKSKNSAPVKSPQPPLTKESSSEESSEDESGDEIQKGLKSKQAPSSSSSESESTSDGEIPKVKKPQFPPSKRSVLDKLSRPSLTKKKEESPEEESSESESGDGNPTTTKIDKAPTGSSESESASEDENTSKKDREDVSSDSEASSEGEDLSEDENTSEEESDVEMKDSRTSVNGAKRKVEKTTDVSNKKVKLTNGHASTNSSTGETKSVFVGRLSWSVDNDRLAEEFAECGEVERANVMIDHQTGKSRGFGYVHFSTPDAVEKALKLSGKEIDGRAINVDRSTSPDKSQSQQRRSQAFGDKISPPSTTLFVGNLSFTATEDTVWSFFSEYGVKSVRLPTEYETGRPKGYGYVEFEDIEGAKKAFKASSGAEIEGRPIRLDYSQPRDAAGGGRGGDRGGRGRGRGGDRGGRSRGRGGSDRGWRGRGAARGNPRGNARFGGIAAYSGKKTTF